MTDYKPSFLSSFPPVILNLLVINFLFWLASVVLPGAASIDLNSMLGLHYWQSKDFHAYQLLTYMFQHASFNHIFFNMFGLFMFGPVLEQVWGSKRFLFFYLFTGIGAAITQEVMWSLSIYPEIGSAITNVNFVGGEPLTVGASGAIFGILLAFAMVFPDARLFLLFLPIPIKAKYMIPVYALIELFLGVASFSGDNVAHFAHLGGALFGLILILIWKRSARNGNNLF
ncbi:MAG: Rhomboid family protein [Bacteroidetes bacterium]|jgi:membrane associated rhomboid family serine protease|nr:Rhomboid family protein [Bacteroidota bacterium]